MTRNDLYREILPKLVDFLKEQNIITEDQKGDIDDNILLTHYEEAASKILELAPTEQFHKIVKLISAGFDDTVEISNTLQIRHPQALNKQKERLLPFCYKCATLVVMPVKTIICEIQNTERQDMSSDCSNILDLVLLCYKDNVEELKYVWECCLGQHEDDYFLLTTETDSPESNWRLYSYAYFCFVNEKHFERPKVLNFNKNAQFCNNIPYYPNNKYEQYFDAYNVMSESKYSEDVLSRYLRMYQILEYMAYRRALADMTKGNIRENGFVRNIITKATKGSNNEFEELKKGLRDVLPDLSLLILPGDITPDMNDFIKKRLMINDTNYDNAFLFKVVYQLRNCIVHNKESELHFMYANTKVYEHGIELMNLLIQKLEPAIVNVINDTAKTQLEFDNQLIQLY